MPDPTPPATPAPGPWLPPTAEELQNLLPQYEISMLLGRGGMGAVYKGTQIALDRPVAIKILSNRLEEADTSFAERFKNEARALGKLSHPGIVGVYDFGEASNGLLYIVMEFIDGTDVSRMIAQQRRLHTEHAMAITAHVCDALAYAHERGIIHRDIKPANIMVGYDGVVKVADFGLAKMTQSGESGLTQSGMAMGTLHYMAPEALMFGAAVDHRADIYAVGVMLYQMLTGKVPHGMFELPSMQVPGLDPRHDAIIAKAMREDRDIRYQSVRELRDDLDHILTQPVVKVEADATQAPAALPTEVRPQRSAGQPYRLPQADVVVHPKKSSWLPWTAVLALAGMGAWAIFSKPGEIIKEVPKVVEDTAAKEEAARQKLRADELEKKAKEEEQKRLAAEAEAKKAKEAAGGAAAPPAAASLPVAAGELRQRSVGALASVVLPGAVDMKLAYCPPGSFTMGSPQTETWRDNNEEQAQVRITQGFWLGQTEVTQGQWRAVMGSDPSRFKGNDLPVENVSWNDAQDFIGKLGRSSPLPAGWKWALPSEAQWEYACRAGTEGPYAGNRNLDEMGWHAGNSGNKMHPVGTKRANGWGLHDMHGNVWEWCADWYADNLAGGTDPVGASNGSDRVNRGGSWDFIAQICRSAYRGRDFPGRRYDNLGFRVAAVPASGEMNGVRAQGETTGAANGMTTGAGGAAAPPAASTPPSGPTTWTDTKGRSITATFKAIASGNVLLDIAGKVTPVPFATLSEESQKLARACHDQSSAAAANDPAKATKGKPFTNSLGMKFVPVPGANVLFCIHETRKQDYAAYAAANPGADRSWESSSEKGMTQELNHPVLNVNWEDAARFCEWLSRAEGRSYRLPSDHEWSIAVGIGDLEDPAALPEDKSRKIPGVYSWGKGWPPPPGSENLSGGESSSIFGQIPGYRDNHPFTAPVGSYSPNALGIFDLGGNAWEWCQDWFSAKRDQRVIRGAAWHLTSPGEIASKRYVCDWNASGRTNVTGFRVVIVVAERTPGAMAFGTSRYQLVRGAFTWSEARRKAEEMGGHLMTITSREEHDWLRRSLPQDIQFVALGGQLSSLGKWEWITGEPWNFTAWGTGEPNGAGSSAKLEFSKVYYGAAGGWNDISDGESARINLAGRSFMVEWD